MISESVSLVFALKWRRASGKKWRTSPRPPHTKDARCALSRCPCGPLPARHPLRCEVAPTQVFVHGCNSLRDKRCGYARVCDSPGSASLIHLSNQFPASSTPMTNRAAGVTEIRCDGTTPHYDPSPDPVEMGLTEQMAPDASSVRDNLGESRPTLYAAGASGPWCVSISVRSPKSGMEWAALLAGLTFMAGAIAVPLTLTFAGSSPDSSTLSSPTLEAQATPVPLQTEHFVKMVLGLAMSLGDFTLGWRVKFIAALATAAGVRAADVTIDNTAREVQARNVLQFLNDSACMKTAEPDAKELKAALATSHMLPTSIKPHRAALPPLDHPFAPATSLCCPPAGASRHTCSPRVHPTPPRREGGTRRGKKGGAGTRELYWGQRAPLCNAF